MFALTRSDPIWRGEEERSLFVVNDTTEGPRAPAVEKGSVTL